MKKITFFLIAGFIIVTYFLMIPKDYRLSALIWSPQEVTSVQMEKEIPLQVSSIIVKNQIAADSSVVPHEQFHGNAFSCSGCHQSLNDSGSGTSTCLSCHDGTLGFYNVEKDKGESPFHIKAEFDWQQKDGENIGEARSLSCSDCHNPHGSYSDRLLNNNPFGTANMPPENGGYLAKGKVFDYSELIKTYNHYSGSFIGGSNSGVWFTAKDGTIEDTKIPIFMLVKGTGQQLDLVKEGVPAYATAIIVYQYLELPATHQIPYRRGYYIPAKLPWLYGYDYGTPQNHYWTRFFIGDFAPEKLVTETKENGVIHFKEIVDAQDEQWSEKIVFNYSKGFVYATDSTLNSVTSGEVAQSHSVFLDKVDTFNDSGKSISKTNLNALSQFEFSQESIADSNGLRIGRLALNVSKYCSSCHLQYLAGDTAGKFSFAHRNFSNYDKWNCLKCHFGHEPDIEKNKQ